MSPLCSRCRSEAEIATVGGRNTAAGLGAVIEHLFGGDVGAALFGEDAGAALLGDEPPEGESADARPPHGDPPPRSDRGTACDNCGRAV